MISRVNSYMNSMLFKSPISPSESNPYSNMIYGAGIAAKYSSKLNNMASQELASYVKSFHSEMNSLKTSSGKLLSGSQDSVFNNKSVKSSGSSVEALQAAYASANKEYSLKVDKLASGQVNKSAKLEGKAYNSFTEGTNSIRLSNGTKSASISFDIKSYHTNKDVLQEVSNKINAAGINVSSRVVSDESGGSYLELSSKATGASSKFSIEDEAGDFAAKSGIGTTVQNAGNARYTVNGKEYESESNDIKIDNGKVSLRLKSIGEARISIVDDSKAVVEGVKSFAADYNSTLSFLGSHSSSRSAVQLEKSMTDVMKSRRTSLESIGISVSDKGEVEVDDKKLGEALNNNSSRVKNVLSTAFGAAGRINKLAADAETKPVLSYSDINPNSTFNSSYMYNYMNTAQKQYLGKSMQQGILFDTML